eukprot:TRINITY_DN106598_c0_g1_i1.p2 TRINITY_DN106598_c0_g1~~TRINITY_DN106598_c0_g1_i1.p2  ORF type:complete len:255 (+),score=58.90 TRINITY_DN106598_c0_g1_i1:64-828(+)
MAGLPGPLPVGRLAGEVAAQVVLTNQLLAPQIAAEGSNANKRKTPGSDWWGSSGGRKAVKFTAPLSPPKEVTPGGSCIATPGMALKSELNMHCSKIARKSMDKHDILFVTNQVMGGFQATLTMPCMPDLWSLKEFVGEVALTRGEAENSVSGIALKAIKADPVLMSKYSAPPKVRNWNCKGKGKGPGGSSSTPQRAAIPAGGHYVLDANQQAMLAQQAHHQQILGLYAQAGTAQPGVVGFGGGYGYGIAPRGFH